MNSSPDKPSPQDWAAIMQAVDDDCAMSIVADLAQKECTWEQAATRICAYAEAAWRQALVARSHVATPDFHAWLDQYKPATEVFDRGDMAACWYAAERAANAEIVDAALKESLLRTKKLRAHELSGEPDRLLADMADHKIKASTPSHPEDE